MLPQSLASLGYGRGYRVTPLPCDFGDRWLRNTPLLQLDHAKVRIQAQRLTQLAPDDCLKAVACFQYVRSLPFKCCADASIVPSTEVLRLGAGDYNTKATLMVALLRAAGVRARARHVAIGPGVLHGIVSADRARVEHVFTEVLLGGVWLGVDAYGVDLRLGVAARRRLFAEGRRYGYAVHLQGQLSWDGHESAFALFNASEPETCPTDDFGVFDDVQQSHDAGARSVPLGWATNARWGVGATFINRRIKALRRGAGLYACRV